MKIDETLRINNYIETDRIILRSFTIDDLEDFYEYKSDIEVSKFTINEPVKSIAEAEKELTTDYINELGLYAIEFKKDHKCIGNIAIWPIPDHNKASVGYSINRRYWGKGFATEALDLIIKLAFEKLEFIRVEATYYIKNIGSGRVMEKCGMKQEGIFRKEFLVKGEYCDIVHCAILREDFISRK